MSWLKPLMVSSVSALLLASVAASGRDRTPPPAPYGALPSEGQLRWHEMERYAFLHFTVNTFTDREWGYGDEDPAVFNPTDFDADQMVGALKDAGMKGVILTCKHHDGFCLWPTATTEHSIRHSPWKGGHGDVVREVSDACRRHGLGFGVYLSPWDRNSAKYGTAAYVPMYRQQLRELLTQYGPIFEVWHDGANGGDGYYGGAREKRSIDRRTYYDWPGTWEMVRKLQPNAVIFSDVGPDVRWVGNESGFAGETCWATYDPAGEDGGPAAPGWVRAREGQTGHRNGKHWLPAECDVSIRPGWFWHAAEDSKVKSAQQHVALYYRSVGHGASQLLNVPPDRRGRLHEEDVAALKQYGEILRDTFRTNLAAGARLKASNFRGGDRSYAPERLLDGDRYTYWATDDGVTTPDLEIELSKERRFNVIRLRENLRLGQRVEGFAVDTWQNEAWQEVAKGSSDGTCRLVRLEHPVSARKLRLRITQSPVCPALSELGLYLEPGS